MRVPSLVPALTLALLTLACGEDPVAPGPDSAGGPFDRPGDGTSQPRVGVGAFGVLLEVTPSRVVFRQETFGFAPGPNLPDTSVRRVPPIGADGARLEVAIDGATKFYVGGVPAGLSALVAGGHYLILGKVRDGVLHAGVILDLSDSRPSTRVYDRPSPWRGDRVQPTTRSAKPGESSLSGTPLCVGQDFDYSGGGLLEFQGCWGGPSASGAYDIPDVNIACGLLGCIVATRLTWTAALAGWEFGFPFRFHATSPGLVYHVPGTVALDLEPLPATANAMTFSGGLGVGVTVGLDYCIHFDGCYDLGSTSISPFSSVHQATEPAPLPGEVMTIDEEACPGFEVPIPGLEGVFTIGICEDLELEGDAFHSVAEALVPGQSTPLRSDSIHFDGQPQDFRFRPNALSVEVKQSGFDYVPTLTAGLKLQLDVLFVTVYETPTLPITDGPFAAVTTPFPTGDFSEALDPNLNDILHQPTQVRFTFTVAPAPTRLTIISSDFLTEDEPVEARLQEDYDGTPIAGVPVVFTASGEEGTLSLSALTANNGVARVRLPAGEYALTAAFAGSEFYLPSEDHREKVFVYRPTTFVIWGGGAGGVQVGQDRLFWGSQWWKQVDGTDGHGASFKGFALPMTSTMWRNPPAMAAKPPGTMARYISVIVTTHLAGSGANLTGDIADYAILRVDDPAGYQPNPGHDATGVVRAILPHDTPASVAGGLRFWSFGR